MADKQYDFYGSAAYDLRGTAVPKPRPARLPEEKPLSQTKQVQKPRLAVTPLAVVGIVVVMALLLMVVNSYVQLYVARNRIGELNRQLSAANTATEKLRSTYESRIDLAQIEMRAKELGMTQPSTRQTVYLNIVGADHAEVLQVDRRSFLEKAWDAVTNGFNGVLEYFR